MAKHVNSQILSFVKSYPSKVANIDDNIKNLIKGVKSMLPNQLTKENHIQICMLMWMHDLLHLPCNNSTPMALCMEMWMNDTILKQETLRESPNLAYHHKQTCEQRSIRLKSIQEG